MLYGHLEGFGLSALGRAQASALGVNLQGAGLKRIVHSPLLRAAETARIIAEHQSPPPDLQADPELQEAEFSRYLQGVPYWQIPIRRPLWLVHKAKRGLLPGDETVAVMGERILRVVRRLALDYPDSTVALVSHADPLNAALILLDGRPQSEREMHRSGVAKAGMVQLEMEGDKPKTWHYIPPPHVDKPEPAAA